VRAQVPAASVISPDFSEVIPLATLTSVNVGLPQDVPWHGRTVHTGAWKQPVDGPRMVRKLNIDGDGQGDLEGHGGVHRAVLVYQRDSYRHWEEHFGRDLSAGEFGENFTVDGLPDDEVCIGDRYRIGDAVFEVSQPRVTCYRVGMRLGEPQMAALLVSHRRPGFYLRVLTEGEVAAGQEIVRIERGAEGVTVAEVDALLYLPGHPRDGLDRALRIPALSPGWVDSLRSLAEQAASGGSGNTGLAAAASSPPPAWPGFRPLRVTDIQQESRAVFSLSLAAADGSPLPPWQPGQSIALRLRPDEGPPLIRNYSLSNRPGDEQYRIAVKQEPHGAASGLLHARVRVGDTLDTAAPRGTRPVWWLHGARDGGEHPFAAESAALLSRLPAGRSVICYSRPAAGDRRGTDYTAPGHLSADSIAGLGLPKDADAYLCGPVGFMDDLMAALTAAGMNVASIHRETFGAGAAITPGIAPTPVRPPHPPPGPPGTGPTISFSRSGMEVPWSQQYGSLLELAEACDIPTRWSCRTGVCHTCETALLSGDLQYDPEPIDPPAAGNALICCSRPKDGVVLDL
jgi:MOSC domain-containing protein YiiM/ferredoxin-NADP reductase